MAIYHHGSCGKQSAMGWMEPIQSVVQKVSDLFFVIAENIKTITDTVCSNSKSRGVHQSPTSIPLSLMSLPCPIVPGQSQLKYDACIKDYKQCDHIGLLGMLLQWCQGTWKCLPKSTTSCQSLSASGIVLLLGKPIAEVGRCCNILSLPLAAGHATSVSALL